MEKYDINDCDVTFSYVLQRKENGKEEWQTIDGNKLFLAFEGNLNCVAYTYAVDKHIEKSIKSDRYNKGYNEFSKDFQDGLYDTEDNLNEVYLRTKELFKNQTLYYVIVDGSIMILEPNQNILDSITAIYKNSLDFIDKSKYKYLDGFMNYLDNEKGKKRIMKEGN